MEDDARVLRARDTAATRLLRQHTGEQPGAAALALAAEHACAHLGQQLVPLLGQIACLMLFRRALSLAQQASPPLVGLAIAETAGPLLAHAGAFATEHAEHPHLVEAGFVALLAQVLALLDTLIGVGLTRHLLGIAGDDRDDAG